MTDRECTECGKNVESKEGWYECPDCGDAYCPDCITNIRENWVDSEKEAKNEEKQKRKKLEQAENLDEYKQAVCPKCNMEMVQYY